jgi:hypothetical protein
VRPIGETYAPYAPNGAVLRIIKELRENGLTEPVSQDGLEQLGIATTMVGPTMSALVFLGLIDEGGNTTSAFDRLRRASTKEYPGILAEIVRKAYLQIFAKVDPKYTSEAELADEFRRYDPAKQRHKMVRLFLGLCAEAKIINRDSKKPRLRERTRAPARRIAHGSSRDYPLLLTLMQHLPANGCWTAEQRKHWLDAVAAAIDLIIQTKDNQSTGTD